MRRKHLAALMSVSVAALISAATSSQATQTGPLVMGVLKPADSWKVGTVDAQGASFCAMVTKYNSGVGLAFARSPEGYGSVAIDLRENVFKFNKTYEVTLKTDKTGPRTLPGKATSERSMVVQIGDDKALYDSFRRNGTLQLVSNDVDISFSLSKFSGSYKDLVACADKLNGSAGATAMPAVKVKEVEQQALSPIDREIEQLSGKGAEVAAAETGSSLDEQLEAAASADVTEFKQKVASLDKQHAELSGEIATRRDEVAAIEEKKEKVERKLLASVKSSGDAAQLPAASSLTAQELEQREIAASAEAKQQETQRAEAAAAAEAAAKAEAEAAKLAAAQKAELEAKQAQLAKLEAEKAAEAERHVAEFARKERENAEKAAQLAKQAEQIKAEKAAAAEDNKALKANLVSKQAQLADVSAARETQVSDLTKKLATTQGEYQSKIAALEGERDTLRQRLVESETKVQRLTQASTETRTYAQSLEGMLSKSEDARQGLEKRLATLEKTAASLTGDQKALKAAAADAKQLAAVKAELDALKASSAADSAKHQKELARKTAVYEALLADYEQLQAKGSQLADKGTSLTKAHKELTEQLAQKQAQVSELEGKLASLEAERKASAAKAEAAVNDLAAARREIDGVRKSLVIVENGKLPELASKAAADRAALSKAEAEIAKLRSEKTDIEQKLAAQESKTIELTAAQQTELANARAESEMLRKANSELSDKLAAAASQTSSKAQKAELVATKARLEELSKANADLQERLAARPAEAPALSASERAELAENRARVKELEAQIAVTKMAVAPAPAPVVDTKAVAEKAAQLAKAEAEINRLRSEKSSLERKLVERAARATERNEAPVAAPVVASEPAFVPAAALASTEPGAGDAGEEMPAVPTVAVEEERFDDNRAAAFLDRIMSYHRPAGAAKAEAKPVVADSRPVFASAVKQQPAHKAPVQKSYAPVTAAVKSYPPVVAVREEPRKSLSPAAAPAYIDEATTLGDDQANGMTPMPEDDFAAAPAPVSAPVQKQPGRPLSLEGLLTQSGLSGISFKSVDAGPNETVRQWTTGDINGMYEQVPATAEFGYNVQSYLDRYREDCPGQLKVSLGKARDTAAGKVQQADISCPMESNTYSSSFVFTQAGGTFNAILHTGYPQQAAEVKQIANTIAAVAGNAGIQGQQSAAPVKVQQASSLKVTVPAEKTDSSQPQRRFNIREEQPAANAAGDEFETVIVQ